MAGGLGGGFLELCPAHDALVTDAESRSAPASTSCYCCSPTLNALGTAASLLRQAAGIVEVRSIVGPEPAENQEQSKCDILNNAVHLTCDRSCG